MARGSLTNEIKNHKLGKDFTKDDVRLIVFLYNGLHNGGYVLNAKLTRQEIGIMREWANKGYMQLEFYTQKAEYKVTEEFYDFMSFVVKHSYAKDFILCLD